MNFKRMRGPNGGVPCVAPWIFTNDGLVQTVPGTVGEITNTAKIACDKEEKARFKPRAMPESREKVITTGSQCKKGKFWD